MTHTILKPDGIGPSIVVGWTIQSDSLPTTPVGSMFWGKTTSPPQNTAVIADPLLSALAPTVLYMGAVLGTRAFGLLSADPPRSDVEVSVGSPVHLAYDPATDRRQNGGLLTGRSYTSLYNAAAMRNTEAYEKCVMHSAVHGQTFPSDNLGTVPNYNYNGTVLIPWHSLRTMPKFNVGKTVRYGVWNGTALTGLAGYESGVKASKYYIHDVLNAIYEQYVASGAENEFYISDPGLPEFYNNQQTVETGTYYITDYGLEDLSWSLSAGSVTIDYTWFCATWISGKWPSSTHCIVYRVHKNVTLSMVHQNAYVSLLPGQKEFKNVYKLCIALNEASLTGLRFGDHILANETGYSFVKWIYDMEFAPTVHERKNATASGEGGCLLSNLGDMMHAPAVPSNIYYRSRSLDRYYREHAQDLHTTPFFSSGDALDKYIQRVSSNQLENLTEVRGLASGIQDAGRLLKAIREFRRGNPVGAIKSSIDAYSNANLAKAYGFDPSISDFNEFVGEYDGIVRQLREENIWGPRTLYGSFDFDMPNDPTLGVIKLCTRSKIRVTFDDTTLMSIIMAGGAIGLRPGFATVWEAIPFSFVVDWFSNLSARYHDIDNQITFYLLPYFYGVHSIKLTNEWGEDFLSSNHLSKVAGIKPTSTFYYRWLSFCGPTLRDSSIDFRGGSALPSWNIAGCLAWAVLT